MTNKTLLESVSSPSEVEKTSPQGWYGQPVIPFIPQAKAMSGAQFCAYMKMLLQELQMALREWDQAIAWYFFTWDLVLRMGFQVVHNL